MFSLLWYLELNSLTRTQWNPSSGPAHFETRNAMRPGCT